MTYQDPNAKRYPHAPVMDVRVLRRNDAGRPVVVEHFCRECGRLISDGKCFGA